MVRYHAILMEEGREYTGFHFYDMTDEDIIALMEMASKGGQKVAIKFYAEKDSPDDVAHIGAMDEGVE